MKIVVIDEDGDGILYRVEEYPKGFHFCPEESVTKISAFWGGHPVTMHPDDEDDACIVPVRALKEFLSEYDANRQRHLASTRTTTQEWSLSG